MKVLSPTDDLLAEAHRARLIGNRIVVIDEGVEQLEPGRLGALLAARVADVLELAVFILEFEVVPVFAAQEHTGIAVLQFQIMNALEDLRKRLPTLEVQVTVIGRLRQTTPAVVGADQVLVGIGSRPARPH